MGVGLDFPPVALGLDEIQIHQDIATQLDLSVGDTVAFIINGTSFYDNYIDNTIMLALLTAELDDVHVDFARN